MTELRAWMLERGFVFPESATQAELFKILDAHLAIMADGISSGYIRAAPPYRPAPPKPRRPDPDQI